MDEDQRGVIQIVLVVIVLLVLSLAAFFYLKPSFLVQESGSNDGDLPKTYDVDNSVHYGENNFQKTKVYVSGELGISFNYPDIEGSEATYDPNTKSVSFTYIGEYQGSNMAHVDGVEMLFLESELQGNDLLGQVRSTKLKPSEDIQEISYNGIEGYQSGSLEEGTISIYFQNSPSSFITVLAMVLDDNNVGYKQIVEGILSSLNILSE